MGAEFLMLDFEEGGDGSETGGYAKPSSPEFQVKQLALFREQAPEIDIVITTALIPGRPAPKLWTRDMVEAMRPGSVVVDLAAEAGGNCELTVPDEKIVTEGGVTVVGYTDYPSRMATQASTLYATNVRHMLTDLTPEKDGALRQNMDDDVIRGATVAHGGEVTYPPPKPKVAAIAAAKPKPAAPQLTPEEKRARELAAFKEATKRQVGLLAAGAGVVLLLGLFAAGLVHGALHRLRAGLLRGLPGHLGRQPRAPHAADVGDQRHLGDHHPGRAAADRLGLVARDAAGRGVGADRGHQHRRRLPGHAPDALHVPAILRWP